MVRRGSRWTGRSSRSPSAARRSSTTATPGSTRPARRLFTGLRRFLAPGATLAVEVSQVRRPGVTRPLVWELGQVLSELFTLREDVVRVNTGPHDAGPGYRHSHVLIFTAGG